MKRANVHLLVDICLGLGALALLWTGLLLYFVLPAHSRQAAVFSLTRHDWGEIHFYIALGMLGLLLVHLALNWTWLCNLCLKLVGRSPKDAQRYRTWVAAGILLALTAAVAASLFLATLARTADPGPPRDGRARIAQLTPPTSPLPLNAISPTTTPPLQLETNPSGRPPFSTPKPHIPPTPPLARPTIN